MRFLRILIFWQKNSDKKKQFLHFVRFISWSVAHWKCIIKRQKWRFFSPKFASYKKTVTSFFHQNCYKKKEYLHFVRFINQISCTVDVAKANKSHKTNLNIYEIWKIPLDNFNFFLLYSKLINFLHYENHKEFFTERDPCC